MNGTNTLFEVARWEFRRYVKLKQQIVGLAFFVLLMFGGALLGRMGSEPSALEVAVVGSEGLSALPETSGRFHFSPHPDSALPSLEAALGDRELDAILVLEGEGRGTLRVRQSPGWLPDLEQELTQAVGMERIGRMGLEADALGALFAPFDLEVEAVAPRAGTTERIAAFAALGLTLLGIFSGIGYIFSSVTGEKQNRLSEQVISAIAHQTWIDGKILGLSAVSAVAVVNALIGGAIFWVGGSFLWGWSLALPGGIERPELLLAALVFVVAGFLFWFALMTAVAAIMEDPHTSNRTQFMFLPTLPLIPAFMAVSDPGALWIRVLGILPPTSGAVMPVRLLVTDVPLWEVVVAGVLLVLAIWLMSRIAGRVFRLGMLMYGKEPSWAEVRKWLADSGAKSDSSRGRAPAPAPGPGPVSG